jgi:aryl-alcohol dehydrogenase-like predicted oxidoreductase
MKKVVLGRTGIEVSGLGIGTGTALPSGHCAQASMGEDELAGLLVFAFDRGITLWDTAFQYGTYPHIKRALTQVRRSDVVITTKFATPDERDILKNFDITLRDLDTDYIDVCLLHGVRTESELKKRAGALEALVRLKEKGKVRAVGLSSHGLGALKAVAGMEGIEAVWARVNFAGLCMDEREPGLYESLASVPWLRRVARLLPNRMRSAVRPDPGSKPISADDRFEVEKILGEIHAGQKGVVGMKVLAEGRLGADAARAVEYVRDLPFVDSIIVGMTTKTEIEENCRLFER